MKNVHIFNSKTKTADLAQLIYMYTISLLASELCFCAIQMLSIALSKRRDIGMRATAIAAVGGSRNKKGIILLHWDKIKSTSFEKLRMAKTMNHRAQL